MNTPIRLRWWGPALIAVTIALAFFIRSTQSFPIAIPASASTGSDDFASTFSENDGVAHAVIPVSRLAGTTPPDGLRTDAAGHLIKSSSVRDVFDYYWVEVGETSVKQVDETVRATITQRLSDPARREAQDLWSRYLHYLIGRQKVTQAPIPSGSSAVLDQFQRLLTQRTQLREQMLPDVATAWFGDEEKADQDMLARMQVAADRSLTEQQRSDRLAALDAMNPSLKRAESAGTQVSSLSHLITGMQQANATPQDIAAAIGTRSDSATAQRVEQWVRQDADWVTRYAQYRAERQVILDSAGGSTADWDTQISRLRDRYFPIEAEAVRAAARDEQSINQAQ